MASAHPKDNELALPALIARKGRTPCAVTIMNLSELRCCLQEQLPAENSAENIGDAMQLWIGAVGPLHAHRSAKSAFEIEFDGPIDPAIVEHFRS